MKCQTNVSFIEISFRFRQSLRTFPVIVSNNYPKISGKMSFTIEVKAYDRILVDIKLINDIREQILFPG
jgi:hypothetical protein